MKIPPSRICGNTISGMNCTTWNSVRANALANRPSVLPSTASVTATATMSQGSPLISRPHTQTA